MRAKLYEGPMTDYRNPFFGIHVTQENKRRKLKVTKMEQDAWQVSDTLEKAIYFMSRADLTEKVRRKMIRDMIKDNLVRFYLNQSNTKPIQEKPTAS